jgi:hypothetical protein
VRWPLLLTADAGGNNSSLDSISSMLAVPTG